MSRMGSSTMLTAAMLIGALSCDPQSEPNRFRLVLEFASQNGGSRACPLGCSEYPIDCVGRLGIRIVDAYDATNERAFRCTDTPSTATTMCGLGEINISFGPIATGPSRAEVALWRKDVLNDSLCLREPIFDLQGEPLITVRPQPAVGGAVYVNAGVDERVVVPMACSFPDQMTGEMCPPD